MKVGFSGFVLDGGKSGVSTYILELLKALYENDSENQYDLMLNKQDIHLIEHLRDKIAISPYSTSWSHPIANILWHNCVLPFTSFQKQYDVVHIPDNRRVPFVKGSKIVTTTHDLGPIHLFGKYDSVRTFYHKQVLTRSIHTSDHVICVSQATKNDVIRFTGYPEDKISVIYSGINTERFRPLPKEEVRERLIERYLLGKPYFIYVSRIEHPAKNHINLIKAFELFRDQYKINHQLVFVGATWFRGDEVYKFAKKSRYSKDILFLGFIPPEDVVDLYNGADAMVFPSLHEGFGFPLLEAMACGTPVACSNTTSLGELGKGYAHLFDPLEPADICGKMALAQTQTTERTEKCLQYARSFNWNQAAKDVIDVYKKI